MRQNSSKHKKKKRKILKTKDTRTIPEEKETKYGAILFIGGPFFCV